MLLVYIMYYGYIPTSIYRTDDNDNNNNNNTLVPHFDQRRVSPES